MEVTKREILFSTIIFTFMIGLGVLIENPIISGLTQDALEISSAVSAQDSLRFGYFKRTDPGLFLAEGELQALNPVSIKDIPGKYLEIEKIKERYTEHVHVHTTTDGKGHTRTYTTVDYSWDKQGKSEEWKCDSVIFLGENFSLRNIDFHYYLQKDTIIYEKSRGWFGSSVGDIRYVYKTWPEITPGLMIGSVEDKTWKDLKFIKGETIQGKIDSAERDIRVIPWVFWVLWILLTGGLIVLFYYFENRWLED